MTIHVQHNVVFVVPSIFCCRNTCCLPRSFVEQHVLGPCLPIVSTFSNLYIRSRVRFQQKSSDDTHNPSRQVFQSISTFSSLNCSIYMFHLLGNMSSNTLSTSILIVLHFSTCLATSDPNLYSNKSQPLDNDAPKTTASSGPADLEPTHQVIHIFMSN